MCQKNGNNRRSGELVLLFGSCVTRTMALRSLIVPLRLSILSQCPVHRICKNSVSEPKNTWSTSFCKRKSSTFFLFNPLFITCKVFSATTNPRSRACVRFTSLFMGAHSLLLIHEYFINVESSRILEKYFSLQNFAVDSFCWSLGRILIRNV